MKSGTLNSQSRSTLTGDYFRITEATSFVSKIMLLLFLSSLLSPLANADNLPGTSPNNEAGIQFRSETWYDLMDLAKAENKMIFLDAYASWCGPCKWMSNNVFTDTEVGKFFNENFLSVKVDMEKGIGLELAKNYNINAYPTLLFLDSEGLMIHRICGARNVDALINEGKIAMTPGMRLRDCITAYNESADKNLGAFKSLLIKYDQACMDNEATIDEFFNDMNTSDLFSEDVWDIVIRYVDNPYSRPITLIIDDHSMFYEKFGSDAVDEKIFSCFTDYYPKVLSQYDPEKIQEFDGYVQSISTNNVGKLVSYLELQRLKFEKKFEQYGRSAVLYMESFPSEDPDYLNQIAWYFYENVNEFDNLLVAIEWAKKSIELKTGYANLDTLAALYYKIGEKESAFSAVNEAIDFAKSESIDYSSTEELLKKIELME